MFIFITGPSASGKSTLRDSYCSKKGILPTSAITTRPPRSGEVEVHRSISCRKFNEILKRGQLCLVAENHGHKYGYMRDEILGLSIHPRLIEVDSCTVIRDAPKFNAKIVRIIPFSKEEALFRIGAKGDGLDDRVARLHEEMDNHFIETRRRAGDVLFINRYDSKSIERFCLLIDRIVLGQGDRNG